MIVVNGTIEMVQVAPLIQFCPEDMTMSFLCRWRKQAELNNVICQVRVVARDRLATILPDWLVLCWLGEILMAVTRDPLSVELE